MNKKNRHKAIKEIIMTKEVSSQEMLLGLLLEQGVEITQATLSRDINEMMIIKTPISGGGYVYRLSEQDTITPINDANLSSLGYVGIEFSGNLAVLKTRPGYAMGIASEIDHIISKEILGTVAGDDTILLVIRENVTREQVLQALSKIINL